MDTLYHICLDLWKKAADKTDSEQPDLCRQVKLNQSANCCTQNHRVGLNGNCMFLAAQRPH